MGQHVATVTFDSLQDENNQPYDKTQTEKYLQRDKTFLGAIRGLEHPEQEITCQHRV